MTASLRFAGAALSCLLVTSCAVAQGDSSGGPAAGDLAAAGATGEPSPEAGSTPVPETTPASSPTAPPPAPPKIFMPAPDKWVPRSPAPLARMIHKVHGALILSIEEWVREGDPSVGRPPKPVVLQSLYQQRIYRMMVRKPRLGRKTLNRVKPRIRPTATSNWKAGLALRRMVHKPASPDATLKVGRPAPAGELLRYYKKAERRFGVHWEVLASINKIESRFGRVKSQSYAGAQGPMQFMPATWEAYGMGGDIEDPHDAIMAAANYLKASGAPNDYRSAVWNYNHSYNYVEAIMRYARRMMANPRNFYAYYNWQVYILTTAGDKRLTGPRPR